MMLDAMIFPLLILSAVILYMIFGRPMVRRRRERAPEGIEGKFEKRFGKQKNPPFFFDGAFSPFAYSSLSELRQIFQKGGEKGRHRRDREIEQEAYSCLNSLYRDHSPPIQIEVVEGRLTLSGTVGSNAEKSKVEEAMAVVPGVLDISNQLVVDHLHDEIVA